MIIVQPEVKLEWITPNPLQEIEAAGRTCYKSEDKITPDSAVQFCQMIYQRGHESVVEHACASFRIICDRGVSHEIVRHRLASYSQESTRYCNYSKDKFGNQIKVIRPPGLEENTVQGCDWEDAVKAAEDYYFRLIKRGMSPQIARSVLPNCLKTELVMTANFREWSHFIKLRSSLNPGAHPQMRQIADMVWAIMAEQVPSIFGKDVLGAKK